MPQRTLGHLMTAVLAASMLSSCQNGAATVDCHGVDREEMLTVLRESSEQVEGYFHGRRRDLESAPPEIQAAAARFDEATSMLNCIHRRDHALGNLLLLPVHLVGAVAMQLYTGGKP